MLTLAYIWAVLACVIAGWCARTAFDEWHRIQAERSVWRGKEQMQMLAINDPFLGGLVDDMQTTYDIAAPYRETLPAVKKPKLERVK